MTGWREKLKASTHGEVSRDSIDPYRAAGGAVYHYVVELDELRAEAAEPSVQVVLLAGWVSFALQVLGDELLDADAAADPATAHYLPRVTAAQAMEFYEPVQAWMARAQAARASRSYRLDVPVPEALPEWIEGEPCPVAHLVALRQAVGRLRSQTEALLAGFAPGVDGGPARDVVAQAAAEANSAADYATGLWTARNGSPPAHLHEAIEAHLKHAVEVYFYLGQVAAMPALAAAPRRAREDRNDQPEKRSFLQNMMDTYPQIAQRRRGGGMLSGVGGGLLGGAVIDEILGGGAGGWGDGGGFGGDGDGGFF